MGTLYFGIVSTSMKGNHMATKKKSSNPPTTAEVAEATPRDVLCDLAKDVLALILAKTPEIIDAFRRNPPKKS